MNVVDIADNENQNPDLQTGTKQKKMEKKKRMLKKISKVTKPSNSEMKKQKSVNIPAVL